MQQFGAVRGCLLGLLGNTRLVLLDPIKEHLGDRESSPSSICPSGQVEGNALAEHAHTMAHTCIQKNTINNLVNNLVTGHTESELWRETEGRCQQGR